MEPGPPTPPRLPATREPVAPVAPVAASDADPPDAPPETPQAAWRRFTRSRRGAAGLIVGAAALLLWPFSGWSVLPWLAGVGLLVILRLLRLDGLLRGWVLHLGGLVVVVGLMLSTGPWAWALAASIGVLLAGLAQLPWWRLAAVGAVLCLVSGVGFGFATFQSRQERIEQQAELSEQSQGLQGERRPDRVLGALLEGIGQDDATGVCGLLDEPARRAFVQVAGTADCPSAVDSFHRAVADPPDYKNLDSTTAAVGTGWLTDACRTAWAAPPLGGPTMGRLEIRRSEPPGSTYFVAGFLPC